MPMTDDEARRLLLESPNYLGRWARDVPGEVCEAVWHALQALADRAALVERLAAICERQPLTVGEPSATSVLAAARRHMKGEP